ncbi:AAA family ATPase [Flavobacteriaceae bacterium]|jgi:magnesium chelatase subunit I|nr:AAA family ATPase [Flavobacteriaceae bacterium]MDB3875144.1 AAA family ATPase [Flavobacteriaceae bacterium]MDC0355340.1 AAA family ATPase [Flavobacteriaceae bacterium]MDC0605846.1 AAA family ATPase [Flavobacteriaceae bacterium]MDC3227602.1 AAA family ATPase [Flavobacteriaceae bacterium]|tara:strand:+ start:2573 stop:4024 length:1452 start_codon:yes stop_codon:yes gene_type:complete
MNNKIKTLKELKSSGYKAIGIKDEMKKNLRLNLSKGVSTFEGIHGYEDTVIPDLERAILSGHNINLLGLRGQAKTRLARQLTNLLDDWIPIISGSEINDDPLDPISYYGKERIKELGDETPIEWIPKEDRFFEKLATPDVTVADLIGDIDPIKAASLKLSYSDPRVIHFGMIPRAHRCIFVLNELPDLQARIQVSLFSILQEKEIQIRGFKLRLPINVQFLFTANPEDYTNRGSIVTPLKDRIGSQIMTHYPKTIDIAKIITHQESSVRDSKDVYVPEIAKDIIEQISFEARESVYVDSKSGVSARLSISAFENLISSAKRRMLINGESNTTIRMTDFNAVISAINGKIELVYEGEQEGATEISRLLILESVRTFFVNYFPKIKKLNKSEELDPYSEVLDWFKNKELFIDENLDNKSYNDTFKTIKVLKKFVKNHIPKIDAKDENFMCEFLLWGLSSYKKVSITRTSRGLSFSDSFSDYINGL